ncbi:MAG: cytochrome [Nocardia sp.]|nr:cytochrome [Nocardia sp.]
MPRSSHWPTRTRHSRPPAGSSSWRSSFSAASSSWTSTNRLETLDLVIKEALRLVARIPLLARETVKDTTVLGHHLPARTTGAINPQVNHFDPQYWTAPMTFDPERFNAERREDKSHRYAWMPFGGGAHPHARRPRPRRSSVDAKPLRHARSASTSRSVRRSRPPTGQAEPTTRPRARFVIRCGTRSRIASTSCSPNRRTTPTVTSSPAPAVTSESSPPESTRRAGGPPGRRSRPGGSRRGGRGHRFPGGF